MDSPHKFKDKNGKEHKITSKHIDALIKSYKNSTCSLVNTKAKTRIDIDVVDDNGDVQPMNELTTSIRDYVKEQLSDDESALATEFYPMLASSLTHYAIETYPKEIALFILTNELAKDIAIKSMLQGLLIGQLMKNNNLQVNSTVTKLSDEEMKAIERTTKIQDLATHAALASELPEGLRDAVDKDIANTLSDLGMEADDFEDPEDEEEDDD